ncbi:MAG: glycoside hydrolase family 172 protein [Verrucomicrobiota bacterium]
MRYLVCVMAALSLPGTLLAADQLSYVDLVKRLTDLEQLAVPPLPGELCGQWSSYDRRSRYDEATGKYVGWDANGDGGGLIRKEGDQVVFAEMEGPGCLWRIWSATPKQGRVKIYLDGAAEPAVDLPFEDYFNGKAAPFTRSALVHTVAMGWNNYTPIPYQKSCKIVGEPNWGNYYQFGFSTFPKGTRVPTFQRQLSAEENAALDQANQILKAGAANPAVHRRDDLVIQREVTVAPGQTVVVADIAGARAITGLRARLDVPPEAEARTVLRELALSIKWDGATEPSVWSPFNDFFGTAAGAHPYQSLPLGLNNTGWWYSYWFMPFGKGALVELSNAGKEPRTVTFEVTHTPLAKPADQYLRFHAKWHRDAFLPAEPERKIDWTMLKTEGAGRFVGVMLHVWNPKGKWWGEGDEKFFVDGEKFPSTFGTGSEDYFGYAWCCPTLFQNCYHNQTISMNNKGHISVNRWHIADNVPFQKSFEGDIEKYFPNARPTLYACISYWYLAAGGKDPYPVLPISERVGYWEEVTVNVVKGALEGESLKILSKTAGNAREQALDTFPGEWSNGSQLWWTGAKPGDKLTLAVPVKQAGTYKLSVQLTKAKDYGIVQLSLDGKKLGEPIDLYDPEVMPSGVLNLGSHSLDARDHELSVEIIGANPAALKGYMFGLDYVKLEP